jgi:cation:H+ antiporter
MMAALMFVAGLGFLYIGGEGLVRSAAAIGVRIGMSPLVVGLTLVAFATSAPELAVCIGAALRGEPGLALGNVVGSNIANLTLVVGIVGCIAPSKLRDKLVRGDVAVLALSTVLVPALLLDGVIMRIEGGSLILAMMVYLGFTLWRTQARRGGEIVEASSVPILTKNLLANALIAIGALGLLILGSDWLVSASIRIAIFVGVAPAIIGLSAAALGTSLPEIAASIVSARHGHADMAAGNLIGSNIFNLLMVLGATAIVRPLERDAIGLIDIGVMVGTTLGAIALMVSSPHLDRRSGTVLIAVYAAYVGWLFIGGHGA